MLKIHDIVMINACVGTLVNSIKNRNTHMCVYIAVSRDVAILETVLNVLCALVKVVGLAIVVGERNRDGGFLDLFLPQATPRTHNVMIHESN